MVFDILAQNTPIARNFDANQLILTCLLIDGTQPHKPLNRCLSFLQHTLKNNPIVRFHVDGQVIIKAYNLSE